MLDSLYTASLLRSLKAGDIIQHTTEHGLAWGLVLGLTDKELALGYLDAPMIGFCVFRKVLEESFNPTLVKLNLDWFLTPADPYPGSSKEAVSALNKSGALVLSPGALPQAVLIFHPAPSQAAAQYSLIGFDINGRVSVAPDMGRATSKNSVVFCSYEIWTEHRGKIITLARLNRE